MIITPNGIKIKGRQLSRKSQFEEYHLIYLKIQRLLIKEFEETKNPEYKKMIEEVGETYKRTKLLYEIPF